MYATPYGGGGGSVCGKVFSCAVGGGSCGKGVGGATVVEGFRWSVGRGSKDAGEARLVEGARIGPPCGRKAALTDGRYG